LAAPIAVQAQFTYTTNAGGASITITHYTGPGGAVTIPTNINSLTVTGIGEFVFAETAATAIVIPDGVTSMSDYAFANCESLTNVTISSTITSVSDFAFENSTELISVAIPNSITNIGYAAFASCTNLNKVVIPELLT